MTDACVPTVRTTFSLTDYCKAVLRAWKPLCGDWPSKASVGVLWSQYALETGRGASCWCNNIGNVKYQPGHPYCMLNGVWEMIGGKRVIFTPPARETWFRAYESLDDAMMEQLRLLHDRRYKTAWPAVVSGDPGEFAVRLRAMGYYTASVESYSAGLRAQFSYFMAQTAFEDACHELAAIMEQDTLPDVAAPDSPASSPTLYVISGPDMPIIHPRVEADPTDDSDDAA